MRVNPKWIDERRRDINAIVTAIADHQSITFTPIVTSWNVVAQRLVKEIAEAGLIPKVEQLGAGVRRISIVGSCCPTCGKKAIAK